MRVLLVNPTIDRDLELWHLGTAALGSLVNAVGRHRAEVVDFTFFWDRWEAYLRERLLRFRPQVLAISTVTPRMPSVRRIARAARAVLPELRVVLGGHHASLDTRGCAALPEVDLVVVGEGEHVFHAVLDAWEDGQALHDIPGLAWREGDGIVETGIAPLPRGPLLDSQPPNDWTLWEQHRRMIFHAGHVPMIGVRGCPYTCSFCSSPVLAKRLEGAGPFVRKRSAAKVAEEAAWQWERHRADGLRYLNFYDQNFLMHRGWLEEFVGALESLGVAGTLKLSAYSRVDHITEDRLRLAKAAGVTQLRLGIEAGDPTVRNNLLNKELDDPTLREKLALVRASGIRTLGYFLVGAPGETPAQADASWRLARETKLDRAAFFFFTPLHRLEITERRGFSVDYLDRDQSATFYQGGELTEAASGLHGARLRYQFLRANGYFLARTVGRQARALGPRWVAGFPRYWREARADGLDAKLAVSQYVYYHGDAFFT
ncbi:MAG: hypothetical protein RLZZ299_2132 [Pseudomonadota bacterium]|jgi:radical SAM superfamily enzyme YgiQ (UPF0313 family)